MASERVDLTKKTPGSWRFDKDRGQVVAADPYGHGEMLIADVRGWGHLIGSGACNHSSEKAAEIQYANGELLAAAPLLLAEVERLREENERLRADNEHLMGVIRKAGQAAALRKHRRFMPW